MLILGQAFLNAFCIIIGALCIALDKSKEPYKVLFRTLIVVALTMCISKSIAVPIATIVVAILILLAKLLKLYR